MLNVEVLLPLERVSETVLLIELHTPAAPSTDHTMKTDTTVTTPKAIARRKDTFITDHGSMRLSRSRARRGPRADAGGVRRAGCGSPAGGAPGRRGWGGVGVGARGPGPRRATASGSPGSGWPPRPAAVRPHDSQPRARQPRARQPGAPRPGAPRPGARRRSARPPRPPRPPAER